MTTHSLAAGGFNAGVNALRGDQRLDVVQIGNFWRVHHRGYERSDTAKATQR